VKQVSIGLVYTFQPRQIVCLEHENTRLYAEVVEVVVARQVCWVRPLILAVPLPGNEQLSVLSPEQLTLYDLRLGSDLLWPASLFKPALDTEVIPLLVKLDAKTENNLDAHQHLSRFIGKVWQAYKSVFQRS
jgi:hypothetical protein